MKKKLLFALLLIVNISLIAQVPFTNYYNGPSNSNCNETIMPYGGSTYKLEQVSPPNNATFYNGADVTVSFNTFPTKLHQHLNTWRIQLLKHSTPPQHSCVNGFDCSGIPSGPARCNNNIRANNVADLQEAHHTNGYYSVQATFQNLSPGTYYTTARQFVNGLGTSEYSDVKSFTVLPLSGSGPELTFDPNYNNISINGSQISCSLRVVNQGTVHTSRSAYVEFRLSKNLFFTTNDLYITRRIFGIINNSPGANYKDLVKTFDIASIFPNLQGGTYYISYKIDSDDVIGESDELNNTYTYLQPYQNNISNLYIHRVIPSATNVTPGQQISANLEMLNGGNIVAPKCSSKVYFQTNGDPNRLSGRILVDEVETSGPINPNAIQTLNVPFNNISIPTSAQAGQAFLCFFVDSDKIITESDEQDNAICIPITVTPPPEPEIELIGNGVSIAHYDIHPSSLDSTEIGSHLIGDEHFVNYTIQNTGPGNLTISNPIQLTGAYASDYSIAIPPASNIPSGQSSTFRVRFAPSTCGAHEGRINIGNNDANESPYIFEIEGTGDCSAIASQLSLVIGDCGKNNLDPINARLHYTTHTAASNYRIRISGGNLAFPQQISSGNDNNFNLNEFSWLGFNEHYQIEIAANVGGNWSPYGPPCDVFTKPLSQLNLRLVQGDCQATNLDPSNAQLHYQVRSDATDYRIRMNGTGVNNLVIQSGNDNNFNLNQFAGVLFGEPYDVEVAAFVNGQWSNYGQPCTITTVALNAIPGLQLVSSDCGKSGLDPNNAQLHYQVRSDATDYRIRINGTGVNNIVVQSGNDNNFNLNQVAGVLFGESYDVYVAAFINGQWSNYGPPCDIFTAPLNQINLQLVQGDCQATNLDPSNAQLHYQVRSDATDYRIRINGTGVNNIVVQSGNDNNFNLNQVAGVLFGESYDVYVAAFINGQWSNYGQVCTITTIPLNTIPGPELVSSDCGRTGLDPINARLHYQVRSDATNYRIRLNGPGVNNLVVQSGNDNNFNLNQFAGVQFDESYDVYVAAFINGQWTNYGQPCPISTLALNAIPGLELVTRDCGRTGLDPTHTRLHYQVRSDASNYRIRCNGPSVSNFVLISGNDNNFNLNQIPNLQFGQIYTIEVACQINGQWSAYGGSCDATIMAAPSPTPPFSRMKFESGREIDQATLNIYPNPSYGDRIYLHYQHPNQSESRSIRFELIDLHGKLLLAKQLTLNNGEVLSDINGTSQLSKGIYFAKFIDGTEQLVKRFVIQ